jgi:hypothetical protein
MLKNIPTARRNSIISALFRGASLTPVASPHVGLLTACDEDGDTFTEVSAYGYARKPITYGAAAARSSTPTSSIVFDAADEIYGTVTHYGIFDGLSGDLIFWGRRDINYTITAVSTGSSTFTIAGDFTARFTAGTQIQVTGSTGNNGTYTVDGSVLSTGNTIITVDEPVVNATADGVIRGPGPLYVPAGAIVTVPATSLVVSMKGAISTAAANAVLETLLRGTSWSVIAAVYMAFLTAYTNDSSYTEVSGANYARQALTFASPSGGSSSTSSDVFWSEPGDVWGDVLALAVFSAASAGTLLWRDTVSPVIPMGPGNVPQILTGDYAVNLNLD